MEKDVKKLIETCQALWEDFNNCRAYFPNILPDMVGMKRVETAPYYKAQGFNINFIFNEGVSEKEIKRINRIGHWINQNFIIRLYAVLESYHIVSDSIEIDFNLKGAQYLDLVRRFRNYFAHSSGIFKPSNIEHNKTIEVMNSILGIHTEGLTDWPLSIGTVLKPLFDGCILYSTHKMNKANNC